MTATPGDLPRGRAWAFEIVWHGLRAMVANEPGLVTIVDARGEDVTAAFPEVRRIGRALGAAEVVIDGVITVPDPSSIERRRAASSDSAIRRLARDLPATFVGFDLLWLDGHSLCDEPWRIRRERLDALELAGDAWSVPAAHVGDGAALREAARAQGLDGLVAKRATSRYEPGAESRDWVAIAL